MTTIVMKVDDVARRCLACISCIDRERLELDTRAHTKEFGILDDRNKFWNKWTLGLVKRKTVEQLLEKIHISPEKVIWGKWKSRAHQLHNMATLSTLDTMNIDKEDAVVMNWT
jgi:hypothetical protein